MRLGMTVVAAIAAAVMACGGARVETSRIDCSDANNVTITASLVGVVSVSGDYVSGTITINCAGQGPVSDVYITGSAGWWNIVSVGPSDAAGVITVRRPAEALGNDDINTTKTVDIIVNGFVNGVEAEATNAITISVVIT